VHRRASPWARPRPSGYIVRVPEESSQGLLTVLWDWVPFALGFVLLLAVHRGVWWLLLRDRSLSPETRLPRQLVLIVIAVLGAVVLLVLLPTRDGALPTEQTKGNLLGLFGLMVAAVLTLSSTTLAANAMAGLMLRMQGGFRPGDFVRVDQDFGRVTERGLFHTEIQTEDRDLLTLPNLYLSGRPIRVVRASGTIVTAEVSLGYDVPHARATELLTEAAASVGLTDPFVWITELKDHAVCYKVCGFLEDVKTLVSIRSKLRAAILDTLHRANVEIVSPAYMAQRPAPGDEPVIPEQPAPHAPEQKEEAAPEEIVFDKAEAAQHRESLQQEKRELEERIASIEETSRASAGDATPSEVDSELDQARARIEDIDAELQSIDEAAKTDPD